MRPVYGIEASTQIPNIALQVRAFLAVVPSPDAAWLVLIIGDTAYPIGDAQAALAPQLQESVERLTQDCAYHGGEHANTPSDHH